MNAKVMELMKEVRKKEENQVKPSTELVPDEYDVLFDGKECIHIFVAEEDLAVNYKEFLRGSNITVPEDNVHLMLNANDIETILYEVSLSQKETSALIMLFWGYSLQDGKFILEDESTLPYYKTWTPFLTDREQKFRDIPKVFLFNVIKSKKVQHTDGVLYAQAANPYDNPNEADILIIYKHNDDKEESMGFILELTEHINEYGKQEDLSSIVSIIDTMYYTRPIIISTLLKKFYMVPSELRGHHLNFEMNNEQILYELMKIEEVLTEAHKEKHNGSPSIIKKMKRTFSSFRSKSSYNRDTLKPESTDESKKSSKKATINEKTQSRDPVPRPSIEKSVPRVSTGKMQGRKLSKDEKKQHWIP